VDAARKCTQAAVEVSQELTAREVKVAQLARDGLSNPEIAAGRSSAPTPSSTTWARCSPSSTSVPAISSTGRCPLIQVPPHRASHTGFACIDVTS
jgi:hypothetical protein